MTAYYLDESDLVHYGVKGMKWGVRKEDRTYSTESKAERKASKKALAELSGDVGIKRLVARPFTKEDYDKLDKGKQFFEKGSTFRRVSSNSAETLSGRKYVSHLPEDSALYRAMLPANDRIIFNFGGRKSYKRGYEIEYKTVQKLSAPSEKERVDTFIELMSQPTVQLPGSNKAITGREYLARAGYAAELKKLSDQEAGLRFYKDFNTTAWTDEPINAAYFNSIKDKGYNAIIDDNDRGYVSKAPMILLDPEGTVSVKSVRKLTADEINQEQRRLAGGTG